MQLRPWHVLAPLVLLGLGLGSEYAGFDVWLARHFFDAPTQTWPWQLHPVTKVWLHDGLQTVMVGIGAILLFTTLASIRLAKLRPWRTQLGYLLLVALIAPLLIGAIKANTRIFIPWDLEMFGGTRPYVRVLDSAPEGLPAGRGFPSAHAAGGFVWFSLYFLALQYRPAWRRRALAFALATGLLLGGTQLVRGAHFLSHDLFSAAICWGIALGLFKLYRRRGWFAPPAQRV
ncbi:MAG: phosphatase PAP2 family protein [Planctomycetes bacterium]|nr:phosphatase PAP2 family protein [Planctomycetota bacterium]MCB9910765.1 phosphatase PAP2 family protein [Planctomycetota bacterium]MCB9912791.1 phosphatase PAP2 family protein [Planctomycetota bacterium]HPF14839.1 phosphatase PAP2 family protein [Planctomycetota bacterium]HRV81121.1 phosphatase PAP2 family protein [Planctomycetota bacterium]